VPGARAGGSQSSPGKQKPGVLLNEPEAYQGYTLISPLQSPGTYLIDMQGKVVRTWQSEYTPGEEATLLENGHLLRPAKVTAQEAHFVGAGDGGRIQEFTWEGELIWDFKFHDEKRSQHHAVTRLPNGNILMIVFERKSASEASAAGVKPEFALNQLVDSLVEVKPVGKTGGQLIWEWHLWDHLIQDHDPSKANYGDVGAHPELVDVNFRRNSPDDLADLTRSIHSPSKVEEREQVDPSSEALNKLKAIGYVGSGRGKQFAGFFPDWTHVNSAAYNARLDQIMLSPRDLGEVWIIDHSTTTAEAAGHVGGRSGKGGDLLYRWGNPQAYRAGGPGDQRLFAQHDAHWLGPGLPGDERLLVFNNGVGRPNGEYSSVDEVVLPVDWNGRYAHQPGSAYGPDQPAWSYTPRNKSSFFEPLMSSAQRLPNGNTLICGGMSASLFEITAQKKIVWQYNIPRPATSRPGRLALAQPAGTKSLGRLSQALLASLLLPTVNWEEQKGESGQEALAWFDIASADGEGDSLISLTFRAYRYGRDYPGLRGKDLTPGKPMEELEAGQREGQK
jgi:hypothetical protein